MQGEMYNVTSCQHHVDTMQELNERFLPYRKKNPDESFAEICEKAHQDRVSLSSLGFFKSEHAGLDLKTGKGEELQCCSPSN